MDACFDVLKKSTSSSIQTDFDRTCEYEPNTVAAYTLGTSRSPAFAPYIYTFLRHPLERRERRRHQRRVRSRIQKLIIQSGHMQLVVAFSLVSGPTHD